MKEGKKHSHKSEIHKESIKENSTPEVQEQDNELIKLENELKDQKDKYLRIVAEFDNYKKRTAKERLDLVLTASEDAIKGILPILDDMERSLKVWKDAAIEGSLIEGNELIYKKLFDYLKSKGVSEIYPINEELNTDLHEAVAQFPTEDKEKKNRIIDVTLKGYSLNGKVIRFAQVVLGI